MELAVLGYAGESGSREIWQSPVGRGQLNKRYPARFFRCFEAEADCGSRLASAGDFLSEQGLLPEQVQEASDGGVFAALWNLLKAQRIGACFCQRAIPLRQQTVELCELFGLNPFRLRAEDCFVCLVPEGERFCREAEKAGLAAAVIGYTEPGCAIRRTDGEETAFLRRPEEDELLRFYRGSRRNEIKSK